MLFYGLIIKEENDYDHRKAQKKFELSGQRSKNSTNAQNNSENKMDMIGTWYISTAIMGCFWLGAITTVLPRMTAGASSDTKASKGHVSGQAMPITPTGSWILTVAP